MSKRMVFLAALAACCLTASVALAQDQVTPAAQKNVATPSVQLAADPFLGGTIQTTVPEAKRCVDSGQCAFQIPPGDKCDTPAGCICGFTPGGWACGRF